jgi:GNAT superfamily N-acetyltransferase
MIIAGRHPSTPCPDPACQPIGEDGAVRVTRADPAEAGHLSAIVAAAFADLAPSRWLVPDAAARREVFPEYFRLYVDQAFANGTVYTNADRTAAALWITRVGKAEPVAAEAAAEAAAEYDARLAAIAGPFVDRFREFDLILNRRHPTGTAYDHLAVLAVHPDAQRGGIGGALLAEHHRALDSARTPAYLEAGDAGTRTIYLRHGYKDLGSPISLAPEGPLMYPMWRTPARADVTETQ